MESQRSHRVGEQIHKEVSALLLNGLKDPRIGFVTITAVQMTADMGLARIFFTVIGDDQVRKNTAKGLQSSVPFIRRELARRLRLRHTPDLLFQFDTSIEQGNRIESLLREIHGDESDNLKHPEKD